MGCVSGQKQKKPPSVRDVPEQTILPVININGETQHSISMNSLTEITGMMNTKDPRFSEISIYISRNKKILEPPSPIQEEKYDRNELINSAINILLESDIGRNRDEKDQPEEKTANRKLEDKPPSVRGTEQGIPVININGETLRCISMDSLTEITGMMNTKDPRFSQYSMYISRNKKIEPPSPIQEEMYDNNEEHKQKKLTNSAINILLESNIGKNRDEKYQPEEKTVNNPEQNFPTTPKANKNDSYFLSTQHTGPNSVKNKKQDVLWEDEVHDEDILPFEQFISWKTIRLE